MSENLEKQVAVEAESGRIVSSGGMNSSQFFSPSVLAQDSGSQEKPQLLELGALLS